MTPDPAPTVQQLLTFYLEAGVDCALTDEPVNRLSDPDAAVPASSEAVPPRPVRMAAAVAPAAGEPAMTLAPEATGRRRGGGPPGGRRPRHGRGAGGGDRLGARSGAGRADAGSIARTFGKIRRLRAEIHRHTAGVRRRQPEGTRHVRRRGAG